MSKKYVIEIKPEYEDSFKGVMILGVKDSNLFMDALAVDAIEELNSDYINEHFGDLQDDAYNKGYAQCQDDYSDALKHAKDTAYKKGLHDGESKCGYCTEYQRGLNDAWEAARKIIRMPEGNILDLFPDCYASVCTAVQAILKYDTSEAIARLKAYEEKQNTVDKIEVGDEVAFHHDDRPDTVVVVTYIGQDGFIDGMDGRGTQYAHKNPAKWTKTGRHFDIASILKEMQS